MAIIYNMTDKTSKLKSNTGNYTDNHTDYSSHHTVNTVYTGNTGDASHHTSIHRNEFEQHSLDNKTQSSQNNFKVHDLNANEHGNDSMKDKNGNKLSDQNISGDDFQVCSPMQAEINYIIDKEMPIKIENLTNFLLQFIQLLNPLSIRVKYDSKHDSLRDSKQASNYNSKQDSKHNAKFDSLPELKPSKSNSTLYNKVASSSKESLTSIGTQSSSSPLPTSNLLPSSDILMGRLKFRLARLAAGRIDISGFKITNGKFNIKLSNKAGPTMYTLSKPFIFHNLQKSHHLAVEALNRIEKISQQRKRDLDSKIPKKLFLERFHRLLSDQARLLLQVKEHLETDFEMLSSPLRLQHVTPYASVQRLQDNFSPKLPRDCLLEFSIQNAVCYITLYKLIFSTPEKLKDIIHKLHKPTSHLSIVMPDNKSVGYIQSIYSTEITDNTYLQDASMIIKNAYQTCSRLKDKLDQLKEFDI